jgi:hypothetical protein
LAHSTLYGQPSAYCGDGAVADRQAQSSAPLPPSSREKRLEHTQDIFRRNAVPGIPYTQSYGTILQFVRAGDGHMAGNRFVPDISRPDRQFSTLRHGLNGIGDQIEYDSVKGMWVSRNGR